MSYCITWKNKDDVPGGMPEPCGSYFECDACRARHSFPGKPGKSCKAPSGWQTVTRYRAGLLERLDYCQDCKGER